MHELDRWTLLVINRVLSKFIVSLSEDIHNWVALLYNSFTILLLENVLSTHICEDIDFWLLWVVNHKILVDTISEYRYTLKAHVVELYRLADDWFSIRTWFDDVNLFAITKYEKDVFVESLQILILWILKFKVFNYFSIFSI